MPWFRVDNRTEGVAALVEAANVPHAVEKYLTEYPPDLLVEPASETEIREWLDSDLQPWPI